jgi:hypothetical protein
MFLRQRPALDEKWSLQTFTTGLGCSSTRASKLDDPGGLSCLLHFFHMCRTSHFARGPLQVLS